MSDQTASPPLAVRCPQEGCHAPPGAPCVGQTGDQARAGQGFHGGRHVAAQVNIDDVSTWRRTIVYERPIWDPEPGTPQPLAQYSATMMPDSIGPKYAGYVRITVDAGPRPPEHIVPPAGEQHAFDAARWARRVEVSVSPTGRSARVWVDGIEIPIREDDDSA